MTKDKEYHIISEKLSSIREDTARISEHLRQINGKITEHETRINSNQKGIISIDKKIAYYTGAITVIIVLVNFVFTKII